MNPGLPPVQFDFVGALAMARSMWAFGEAVTAGGQERGGLADSALAEWLGPFGRDFGGRAAEEHAALKALGERFRRNAHEWAEAWAYATNLKAMQEWWAEVEAIKNDRNALQRVGDFLPFVGDVVLPPMPEPVATPTPPMFAGTCAR